MSERRQLRLCALALILVGTAGTLAALAGLFDGTEGTLWFPPSVALGILVLIYLRPRTTNRKDNQNGNQ